MSWVDELVEELKVPEIPKDALTTQAFAEAIGLSRSQAGTKLRDLVSEGTCKRVRVGKVWYYYK